MSRLLALIDDYKDRTGNPSDSSIARAVEVAPQTISSWRKRGFKEPPSAETLRNLAKLLRVDYRTVVLEAVLYDVGLIDDETANPDPPSDMPEAK